MGGVGWGVHMGGGGGGGGGGALVLTQAGIALEVGSPEQFLTD